MVGARVREDQQAGLLEVLLDLVGEGTCWLVGWKEEREEKREKER